MATTSQTPSSSVSPTITLPNIVKTASRCEFSFSVLSPVPQLRIKKRGGQGGKDKEKVRRWKREREEMEGRKSAGHDFSEVVSKLLRCETRGFLEVGSVNNKRHFEAEPS